MIRAETELTISRDAAHVFSDSADLRNEPHWNRGHVRAVVMTPILFLPWNDLRGHHPGFGKATWRIAEFVPPTQITIEEKGGLRYLPVRWKTSLPAGRDRLPWQCRVGTRRAVAGFRSPPLTLVLKIQARRSFRNLRTELERAA